MIASERFAGGPDSIQIVGLSSVAPCWSGWPVDLNNPLSAFE
jgi:hypothetical protein